MGCSPQRFIRERLEVYVGLLCADQPGQAAHVSLLSRVESRSKRSSFPTSWGGETPSRLAALDGCSAHRGESGSASGTGDNQAGVCTPTASSLAFLNFWNFCKTDDGLSGVRVRPHSKRPPYYE